jgi:Male sterility protein.
VNEPLVCWINNIYGAAGVAAGAAMGLIRVVRADKHSVMDIVPGDMVMNSVIAAAWDVATKDRYKKLHLFHNIEFVFISNY